MEFYSRSSLPVTHMLSSLSLRNALFLPLAFLFFLLCPSARRIIDFINADSEGPVVNVSLASSIGCPCRYLNSVECDWPQGGAHTRLPSSCWCLRNRSFKLINKSVQHQKATGSSLSCLPWAEMCWPYTTCHSFWLWFCFVLFYYLFCSSSLVLYVCVS